MPADESLRLTRVSVAAREVARVVALTLRRDDGEGISLIEIVPHELSRPPAQGTPSIMPVPQSRTFPAGRLLCELALRPSPGACGKFDAGDRRSQNLYAT